MIPYDMISLSDFESDRSQRSNLDGLESKSLTIPKLTLRTGYVCAKWIFENLSLPKNGKEQNSP